MQVLYPYIYTHESDMQLYSILLLGDQLGAGGMLISVYFCPGEY